MSDLTQLADDLARAATTGASEAGAGAVQAGSLAAEVGLRTPGAAGGVAVAGVGGLSARVGRAQKRGVYQENSPATALNLPVPAIADTMAAVAADLGARAVS